MNRLSRKLILLLFAGATCQAAHADSARQAFQQAGGAFKQEDYPAAADLFDQAADLARETHLDPAVARYDRANALLRMHQFEEAASQYTEALRTQDLRLQQHAYHNRGNAMMAIAGEKQQQQDLEGAMENLREAVSMYEQAITLDPGDEDPKVNYELAWKRIEELEQQQQEQQQQQDQQQDQEQQQQNQDSQDQQQNQQQDPQNQDQQNQDQQNQQQQDQPEQNDQQDQQEQNSDEQNQKPPDRQPEQQPAPPRPSEEMTPEEAEMLLDAIRDEEEAARRNIRVQYGSDRPVEKDW